MCVYALKVPEYRGSNHTFREPEIDQKFISKII